MIQRHVCLILFVAFLPSALAAQGNADSKEFPAIGRYHEITRSLREAWGLDKEYAGAVDLVRPAASVSAYPPAHRRKGIGTSARSADSVDGSGTSDRANGWRHNLRAGFSTRKPVSGCPTATEWDDSLSGNGEPGLSSEPCNNAVISNR